MVRRVRDVGVSCDKGQRRRVSSESGNIYVTPRVLVMMLGSNAGVAKVREKECEFLIGFSKREAGMMMKQESLAEPLMTLTRALKWTWVGSVTRRVSHPGAGRERTCVRLYLLKKSLAKGVSLIRYETMRERVLLNHPSSEVTSD